MPTMDGMETTRRIRALKGACGLVPILAMSAQDAPEHINRCRRAGMDGHLAKPFNPATLPAIVSRADAARQAHHEKLAWLGSEPVAIV
jgi:CheY-like chemotaxis protein